MPKKKPTTGRRKKPTRKRAAAAKATTTRARDPIPGPGPPDRETIDRVIALMVRLPGRERLAAACCAELKITPGAVDQVISEARRLLTIAADFHREEELGRSLLRLNDLYTRSIKAGEGKTALNTLQEINRLLDLRGGGRPAAGRSAAAEQTGETATAELAAVRDYLEPLALGGPETPTAELARRAVAALIRRK